MDFWQSVFLTLLALASVLGRERPFLVAVMWMNFAATYFFAHYPHTVAIADIVAASLLTYRGWREGAVAALFVLMLPVYLLGPAYGFSRSAIYGIVDIIAYAQLLAVGRIDRGVSRLFWHLRERGANPCHPVGKGLHAARHIGGDQENSAVMK